MAYRRVLHLQFQNEWLLQTKTSNRINNNDYFIAFYYTRFITDIIENIGFCLLCKLSEECVCALIEMRPTAKE